MTLLRLLAGCWCPKPLRHDFSQSGAGAAGVPKMAQDHSTPQHVANSGYDAAPPQRGRLAAAAQPRPAPSHPARERGMSCSSSCHCQHSCTTQDIISNVASLRLYCDSHQAHLAVVPCSCSALVSMWHLHWWQYCPQRPSYSSCSCRRKTQKLHVLSTSGIWYGKCSRVPSQRLLEA